MIPKISNIELKYIRLSMNEGLYLDNKISKVWEMLMRKSCTTGSNELEVYVSLKWILMNDQISLYDVRLAVPGIFPMYL